MQGYPGTFQVPFHSRSFSQMNILIFFAQFMMLICLVRGRWRVTVNAINHNSTFQLCVYLFLNLSSSPSPFSVSTIPSFYEIDYLWYCIYLAMTFKYSTNLSGKYLAWVLCIRVLLLPHLFGSPISLFNVNMMSLWWICKIQIIKHKISFKWVQLFQVCWLDNVERCSGK